MAGPPSAQVGDLFPSFDSTSPPSSINFNGESNYLFLIFSPDCQACISEFLTWRQIARYAHSKTYRVISLSIYSEGKDAIKPSKIDDSVEDLAMPSLAIQRAYRVVAVPAVMLVSADGKVQWVNYGRLSQDKMKELFARIDGKNQ